MKKLIAIGLSPNTEREDILLSFKLLFMPWKYVRGNASKELERWFRTYFKVSNAISFVNARSALYAILHCLEIGVGDEVLLQPFTCVAVPNAIIATGAKPVYVDIDNSLNINPTILEKKITKKTKAILIQHTFSIPANLEQIMILAKKYGLFLIEDCAHTIGGEYKEKKLGTFGIASCFSFGRDKAFSSVFGGMAITADTVLGQKLRTYQKQKNYPLYFWVMRQLCYPLLSSFIINFYFVLSIGKIVHFFLRRLGLFSQDPVSSSEKNGEFNPREVKRFPNALASLAVLQIKKQKIYNQKRAEFTAMYTEKIPQSDLQFDAHLSLLRFPFMIDDKKKVVSHFAKQGIYVGDWYNQPIDPRGVMLDKILYKNGSCPIAEKMTKTIINLPTYPTMDQKDLERVIEILRSYDTN